MTKEELVSSLTDDALIQSADALADELHNIDTDHGYFKYIEETFDLVVFELHSRGLWPEVA